jgi:molybdenum cofactor cytidylyltransferase
MSQCGIVILAAGGASRMGRPKQLLPLQGVSLLRRAVETAWGTACRPIVVVLGANLEQIAPEISPLPVGIVLNPDWQRGIGTSIRAGVGAIAGSKPSPAAVVLMLCDQPLITAAQIDELVQRQALGGKPICAARYSGMNGTPAVFAACLFDQLLALRDDEGGKAVIARHAAEIDAMDLPSAAIDIDTPADFEKISSELDRPAG